MRIAASDVEGAAATTPSPPQATLRRRLNLPLLVLYGVGTTVGAGIYVLIGQVAGRAGVHAPWSFLLAAVVMAFTVASYVEMSTRYPVSAGAAAYVKAGIRRPWISRLTGLLTIGIGVVSSAAVALGSAGYVSQFIDLPASVIVVAVVTLLGAITAWGILQSVLLVGILTLIEVGGLVAVIVAAFVSNAPVVATMAWPQLDTGVLSGITLASLLAFFAFIGFEDLANVVEEAKEPRRNLPLAMVLTLVIATLLYLSIATISISVVAVEQLSASSAPLSLVFERLAGVDPAIISSIAIIATLNTILAQVTMASRVIYGMARQGDLPKVLGAVNARTATPLLATGLVITAVIALALWFPMVWLAEGTSLATLGVFALVNLSLLVVKSRREPGAEGHITVPAVVPAIGLLTCLGMIASSALG
jgi:basic amino acid/polyamine antiporter, APA family